MNITSHESATILTFPRRRGRPRKVIASHDNGTPELIAKKITGETSETIDLCLERRLITTDQHWSGIHLRWLYTLRYGTPTIRALDPTHFGGCEVKANDPNWRAEREKEFSDAVNLLSAKGFSRIVLAACIYNECPTIFKRSQGKGTYNKQAYAWLENLSAGLDILVTHWKK